MLPVAPQVESPPRASMCLVLLLQLAVPAQEHWNKVVLDVVGLRHPVGVCIPSSVDHFLIAWQLLTSGIGFRNGHHDG